MTRYRSAPDRAGWALALGGACVGCAVAGLAWRGGASAPGLAGWGAAGGAIGMLLIAGLGGPTWWLVQRATGGRRGPIAAGLTGAAVAGAVTLAALTRGFGAGLPVVDAATLAMIWTSAAATAAIAGFLGALVALAMWLVSYRAV